MNPFAHKIYHNTIEDWLYAFAIIMAAIVFARFIYWLISKILKQITKRTATELDDMILNRIDTPAALGIVLIGFRFAIEQLTFPRALENYLQRGFVFMSAIAITWFVSRIVRASIEFYFTQYHERDNSKLDEQLMMLSKRTAFVLLWMIGFTVGLNNAGFDVGALIAGLGIGGLALALAAQDTVKNVIGGLIIFVDKPFRIGDFVRIKDTEGQVTYTGIRSTRIRTGAGRVVSIPNAHFSDNAIENISLEPSKRIVISLSLGYETPDEKIDEAIALLKQISDSSDLVNSQESIIFLEKFSSSSIDINFTYFIQKGKDIHTSQTEMNKLILKKFKQAGLEFALPIQTVIQKN